MKRTSIICFALFLAAVFQTAQAQTEKGATALEMRLDYIHAQSNLAKNFSSQPLLFNIGFQVFFGASK